MLFSFCMFNNYSYSCNDQNKLQDNRLCKNIINELQSKVNEVIIDNVNEALSGQ